MSRIDWAMLDVLADLGPLLPGQRQHPVQIVAHDRGLGRHRAHRAQLLQLGPGLVAGLLGELGLLDPRLELGGLVLAVLELAQLLLDRLHLLVQVVLALGLLHLPLDAGADALLDLEDRDLALHEAVEPLQALGQAAGLEQLLLVGDLQATGAPPRCRRAWPGRRSATARPGPRAAPSC